jgi:hypothetical protein
MNLINEDRAASGADFLDQLMLNNHISLKMVYDCAAARYDDLAGMERILDPQNEEDARYFLALPRLLEPEDAGDIIACFKEQHRGTWLADVAEPPLAECAVPVISAFVYNTAFFAMAWKKCELLKQAAEQKLQKKDSNVILIFVMGKTFRIPSVRFEYKAASAVEPGFRKFGGTFTFEGGALETLGAEFDGPYLQFKFSPGKNVSRPYRLEVHFTVAGDERLRVLRLHDAPDDPEGAAYSSPTDGKDIDYTRGIEIREIQLRGAEEGNG